MLRHFPGQWRRDISEGAADASRAPASTRIHRVHASCVWIGSRCRIRTRRAAEPTLRGTRLARDAVPAPAVVADRTTWDDLQVAGASSDALLTALGGFDEAGVNDGNSGSEQYDPSQLAEEQLENRRLSSQAASTSASAGILDGGGSVSLRRTGGGGGSQEVAAARDRSPPAFPTFPRPRTSVVAASSASPAATPVAPSAPSEVPPEAAQLYAGSAVAGNLSSTGGSADVLTPLLDALQLEPPVTSGPGQPASNAQRVYRTAAAVAADTASGGGAGVEAGAGGGAAAGSTSAALPLLVRRKRARTRVLDTSELLLARDEAVRTELISRTWNDLLRFEERLSTAPTSGAVTQIPAGVEAAPGNVNTKSPRRREGGAAATADAAVAAVAAPTAATQQRAADSASQLVSVPLASGLDDVLGFLQCAAAAQNDQQLTEQAAAVMQQRKATQRSARLMGYIARAPTWQRLARLFLKHGRTFSVAHLVATLFGLARFDAAGRVYRGRGRRKAFDRVWDMLTRRVTFAAPRMTGPQLVRVVRAISSLPLRNHQRVEHSLVAVQRVLRYSQHTMLQQAPPGDSDGRVILNTSQAAQQRSARGSRTGQKGNSVLAAAAIAERGERRDRVMSSADVDMAGAPAVMDGPYYAALCYTLGRMNSQVRPWRKSLRLSPSVVRRLLLGSYAHLGSLGPRELAGLLYGLGCMRISPPAPWMYGFYVSSARWLSSMTDVQLTMVMYGACRLKIKPPPPWIEAYLGATGPRLRMLDSPGLAAAMHSLGRLKYKPRPVWTEALMASSQERLVAGLVKPEEMSQLARGLMFLGVRPAEDLLEALWDASGGAMERGEFSPSQLVNLAWALGSLKVPTPRRWYDQLVHQMRKTYPQLRPYHHRRLLAALHAFGCRDLPRWYQMLRVPLVEMPGYAAWSATQAKQRTALQAKATKQGSPQGLKQPAGAQAQGPGVEAIAPPRDPASSPNQKKQQQKKEQQKRP
ncbi:hypothetical protein VOLCADRAFT_117049 [Volvox carteri f. nagariensis]|uniref:Uncharacterized protein n=1 Tax=Volvox carteri f. nagariensis TaxID=3068 RepID=D8TRY7_VOLCA|nr:uncharacterized protein VOLCADRAFT_117049 [Volvox carteri f. nagariensis]EFJ49732.1 hypothetical protein VOLCADRAFT_117049 [Volvox carteri f. nagariensis]|eukprot:XP_002949239.1 hypothetical protein VOLCADRAFT_117049 [Volvox carteri f. nagariensis]